MAEIYKAKVRMVGPTHKVIYKTVKKNSLYVAYICLNLITCLYVIF